MRLHFLFAGDGQGTALFGFGARHPHVRFGLIGLEFRADVDAHVYVGDVDGKDLKGRAGVQPFLQHGLADLVGIFQHFLVRARRADGADDAFADPRDDRLFSRPADQAFDAGAHGHARTGLELDAVFGDGVDGHAPAVSSVGAVDDTGVHRGIDRF